MNGGVQMMCSRQSLLLLLLILVVIVLLQLTQQVLQSIYSYSHTYIATISSATRYTIIDVTETCITSTLLKLLQLLLSRYYCEHH
jgi:hypothetical protein